MGKDIVKTMYDTYWDIYEEHLKKKGENPKNIPNRRSTIRKFFNYLCEFDNKPDFKDIEKVNIQHFLSVQEKTCSPKTLNRYFSFLKDFFMYFKKENVNTNVIFEHWKYRKNEKSVIITLTDDEIMDLFRIIRTNNKSELSLRIQITFLLLTYTGCTKNELCSLNVYKDAKSIKQLERSLNYISLEDKKIYFGKQRKNRVKQRVIPLNNYIIKLLADYIEFLEIEKGINFEMYPFLFPSTYDQVDGSVIRLNSDQITTGLKNIVKESKVLKNKKVSFQAFRNTFIKNMIKDKIPLPIIKELTGLDITSLKRYIDIEQYEKNQKDEILNNRHPYKIIFNKLS